VRQGLLEGGFEFDVEEFWDAARAGQADFLRPDPLVREFIDSLPQDKWVLTNCNEKYAKLAIQSLGLEVGPVHGLSGTESAGESVSGWGWMWISGTECVGCLSVWGWRWVLC
jgi:hypothetical protein